MTIKLVVVSKTDIPFVQVGIEEYEARLKHYCDFQIVVIPALKKMGSASANEVKEKEGKLILKQMEGADMAVLLDEHGREMSSEEFAAYIQKQMNAGVRTLMFFVGGAFGFSEEVHQKAQQKLSLSKMTFNHQMVRLFFVEQLYRAHTILKGEKYHNA